MRAARYIVPALLVVVVAAVVAFAVVVTTSHPSLTTDSKALARLSMPTGGATVERVVATGGREQKVVPVQLRNDTIVPTEKVGAGERITVAVTLKRPGWISWLAGKTETVKLSVRTPSVKLATAYITRPTGKPLHVRYQQPVAAFEYGAPGRKLKNLTVTGGKTVNLEEAAAAGTVNVAAAARSWERPQRASVSWFPAGDKATAIASPAPGTNITPTTKIKLTFSKPIDSVLGHSLPPITPSAQGKWERVNSHTVRYVPSGYGYGLSTHVSVALPTGVKLMGGSMSGSDPEGVWTVPQGTTMRLQELLADLGYLPVIWSPSGSDAGNTVSAQLAAAVTPPQGTFSWRYPDTPSDLKSLWTPGSWGEITKGAVMAFEQDQGLATDGIPGPEVWKALINAAINDKKSTFGYTFVHVTETSPETITVWHNGKNVVQGLANTGIPAAPTATGTYAVYEHIPSGTMSGTNPDGTPYHDPGIPWISYFNGGDALHGFIRGSYGVPQSLGCVEMPYSEAGQVYPYTPIGTIVNIVS